MTTARMMWILWCLLWAAVWTFLGFLAILPWVMVPPSLMAILLPIGKERRPAPPMYYPLGGVARHDPLFQSPRRYDPGQTTRQAPPPPPDPNATRRAP